MKHLGIFLEQEGQMRGDELGKFCSLKGRRESTTVRGGGRGGGGWTPGQQHCMRLRIVKLPMSERASVVVVLRVV